MRIKLMVPSKTILEADVTKITAPGTEGSFQVLPRHVDVAWSLQTGILGLTLTLPSPLDTQEPEVFYAIDRGVLVKCGDLVHVSCYEAIRGDSLEELNAEISNKFTKVDEQEKKTRQVLLQMEMNTKLRLGQIEQ